MLGNVQRQRRLSHRRPRRQDEQFAFPQTARHLVELQIAGADALNALAGVQERIDAAFVLR